MKTNTPTLPESTQMPFRDALKLNAWAGVAVLTALVSRLLLNDHDFTGLVRIAVALLPCLPGVLYVRALWRWMRGLDELQRRLEFEAVCFATLGMLLIALTADLLRTAGSTAWLNFGWEGYFAITFFLYVFGLARANRNYR